MITFPKHRPSGLGKGKWEHNRAITAYRKRRDKANKTAKRARATNRERAA